ncbi:MAG: (2Fe-2S) ferredoxin domain-containing protein [Cyanobacteria bacterium P01_C01_bin.120]
MSNSSRRYLVTVCQHRSCSRSGSEQVLAAFQQHQSDTLIVGGGGCQGQCGAGPLVQVMPDNIYYSRVQPKDVATIVEQHLTIGGKPVEALLNARVHRAQSAYADMAAQYQAFIQPEQK